MVLSTEGNDEQENQLKKLEKPNVNFNESSDRLLISLADCLFCLTVSNLHPQYKVVFIVNHSALVPIQPPDALFT